MLKRTHPIPFKIIPCKQPKTDVLPESLIIDSRWSTKHLHEQKKLHTFPSEIKYVVPWNRFLIIVSESEAMICKDDFESHFSISFQKNDVPAIIPYGNTLLIFGQQDTRQLLWSVDDRFIKQEIFELPLEGIFGYLGCLWGSFIVLGKPFNTQLMVISLAQDDEQCEIVEIDYPVNMICAHDSLWISHSGGTKMYNNIDQLRNGIGISCPSSSELCYWKMHNMVAVASFSTILILKNKTGQHHITLEGHVWSVTSLCAWQNRLYSGAKDGEIRVWNLEGQCLDIIHLRKTIDCLCVHNSKLWVVFEKIVAYYKSKRPWKILKVLWIAHYKNDPSCQMSKLPIDMIRLIICYL